MSIRVLTAIAVLAAGEARAWLLYPDDEKPERLIVEVERPTGDLVPLEALPQPYDSALQSKQGPDGLVFRWRYDRQAEGMAFLRVDDAGAGVFEFGFAAEQPVAWQWLAAGVVLIGRDGEPMHAFLARGLLDRAAFERGALRRHAVVPLKRSLAWWRGVAAFRFQFMTYHPTQGLSEAGVWDAMERAVRRSGGMIGVNRASAE